MPVAIKPRGQVGYNVSPNVDVIQRQLTREGLSAETEDALSIGNTYYVSKIGNLNDFIDASSELSRAIGDMPWEDIKISPLADQKLKRAKIRDSLKDMRFDAEARIRDTERGDGPISTLQSMVMSAENNRQMLRQFYVLATEGEEYALAYKKASEHFAYRDPTGTLDKYLNLVAGNIWTMSAASDLGTFLSRSSRYVFVPIGTPNAA